MGAQAILHLSFYLNRTYHHHIYFNKRAIIQEEGLLILLLQYKDISYLCMDLFPNILHNFSPLIKYLISLFFLFEFIYIPSSVGS